MCLSPGRLRIALSGRVDAGCSNFNVLGADADGAAAARTLEQFGITETSLTPNVTMIIGQRRFARNGMTRMSEGAGNGNVRSLGAGSMRGGRCWKQRKLGLMQCFQQKRVMQ